MHLEDFEEKYPEVLCVLSFTWRSVEEQDALWRLGRNEAGEVVDRKKVVTNARGGASWHNITRADQPASLAYDILLMSLDRKVLPASNEMWNKLGAMGLELGLDWGVMSKKGRWDLGHFYLRGKNRITLDEAKSGIEPLVYEGQLVRSYYPDLKPPTL